MPRERVFGILAVTSPGVVVRGVIANSEHLIATQLAGFVALEKLSSAPFCSQLLTES
jgi:hypothetical protein